MSRPCPLKSPTTIMRQEIAEIVALVSSVVSSMVLTVQPAHAGDLADSIARLLCFAEGAAAPAEDDWLVVPVRRKAEVYRGRHAQEIVMTNGLISRTWRLASNAATVGADLRCWGSGRRASRLRQAK